MTEYRPPAELYPFDSNWLSLDGGRMHYLDEGPAGAPVVLMLHGNPTWSFYYRKLVIALRDRYRCIVPDHIGCGLSDKPGDEAYPYTLDRRIEDISALVRHAVPDRPLILIVHDWGGMIGFAWAERHQPELEKLVIMNTAAFPLPATRRFPWPLRLARTRPGAVLVRGFNAFAGVAARTCFATPVPKAVRRAYTGPYDSWQNRIATLRFVQDIPLHEADPGHDIVRKSAANLPSLAGLPAMIAWGERDFVFDAPFLEVWRDFFPAAEVISYPNGHHYILEDGGDDLVGRIAAFLDRPE